MRVRARVRARARARARARVRVRVRVKVRDTVRARVRVGLPPLRCVRRAAPREVEAPGRAWGAAGRARGAA